MEAYVINMEKRKDRMASFKMNHFPESVKPIRFNAFENPIGEDGCTQSHLQVLRDHFTFPFAVFEDDCVLLQPWSVVEKAMSQLPSNWDALWLGCNPTRQLAQYSNNLYKVTRAYCLHAVIYNSERMVKYILDNHNTPSGKNLDIFIAKEVMPRFNCFTVWPIVATQLSDISDIAKVRTNNGPEIVNNFKRFTYGKF